MIKECRIEGFKSFLDESIKLGALTIFTGLNNSGKSSAIQAIRMALSGSSKEGPYIEGLGGYQDLSSKFSGKDAPIAITLTNNSGNIISALQMTRNDYKFTGTGSLPLTQFISADRYGPRIGLPIIRDDENFLNVGCRGEFSAHYGSMLESSIVAPEMRHPSCKSNTLKHQLTWWMSELSPGVKLEFNVSKKYDSSQLEVNDLRPTNSGFGISYVLPVLLSLLTMSGKMGDDDSNPKVNYWFKTLLHMGGVLLIENPEAHLHPRGQTIIGQLAALAAASGVQVLLETHSDHVVDGVRLAVKQEPSVDADMVRIKFFNKEPHESSKVIDIEVKPDGKLGQWPKGFFDQGSLNLRALAMKV
ncbi:DUF3696 domain-containing protein [Pseudomonas lundensis]|uniref:DUF3696 domain-containing protein n=1 Tax=Pseudomonas lundensis TaxID=86185 RepID=A0ABX4GHQ6_9PSED|nr:DUF3696 domain-containing protein [Pseudomonas lundensis]NMZ54194.1 DUF3696 domain-containing protein [Pseudomonas lundensis]OZY53648.1 hypothetical protein CJF38_19065 [Pseudomonas lundensis]